MIRGTAISLGEGRNTEKKKKNRQSCMINKCLIGWCHQQNFQVFDLGELYMALSLLATDGAHLSQRGRNILAREFTGLIRMALN